MNKYLIVDEDELEALLKELNVLESEAEDALVCVNKLETRILDLKSDILNIQMKSEIYDEDKHE